MIEKRLLFGRGRNCMRWIAFSALIVLIFLSLTTPVFAQAAVVTDKGSYARGETVYATATGLPSPGIYDFYYNPPAGDAGSELGVVEDPAGEWHSSFTIQLADATESWFVRVVKNGKPNNAGQELCRADFTVTDVPEFPSIFVLGAGIMFLICGAIYLGMRKHAMRKV